MTRRSLEPLRDSIRSAVKELVWLFSAFEQGQDPNILLFATRRGGSTWLMQVIAANRGVRSLDQPLEILTPNLTPTHYRLLPKFDGGQLIRPDVDQELELRRFVDSMMDGRPSPNAPYAFWRNDFQRKATRLVLKIVDAKAMIDWFDHMYRVKIVYFVRHPIPQSLSCIRNGWGLTVRPYLRNEWFAEQVLGEEMRLAAEAVLRSGSDFEKMVLNWIVENFYPLKVVRDRPHWLCMSYEEFVSDRAAIIDRLALKLNLRDCGRMEAAALRLSRSSGHSTKATRTAVRSGDTSTQLFGWLTDVSRDEAERGISLLERFGISLYGLDDPFPRWDSYRSREADHPSARTRPESPRAAFLSRLPSQ